VVWMSMSVGTSVPSPGLILGSALTCGGLLASAGPI
jgi:hypothetical protein